MTISEGCQANLNDVYYLWISFIDVSQHETKKKCGGSSVQRLIEPSSSTNIGIQKN
jgi:hypothetical protein